jgi:type I restriction enzyme S subunit
MYKIANFGARHDRMAMSLDDLFDMPVPYPESDERAAIAHFFNLLDLKIRLVSGANLESEDL